MNQVVCVRYTGMCGLDYRTLDEYILDMTNWFSRKKEREERRRIIYEILLYPPCSDFNYLSLAEKGLSDWEMCFLSESEDTQQARDLSVRCVCVCVCVFMTCKFYGRSVRVVTVDDSRSVAILFYYDPAHLIIQTTPTYPPVYTLARPRSHIRSTQYVYWGIQVQNVVAAGLIENFTRGYENYALSEKCIWPAG
jgi:hypothetical protein